MRFWVCTLAALVGTAALAHAQSNSVDATNPRRILEVAKGFGSAELSRDERGDPKISGRMDGVKYSIWFYGCKDAQECRSIQFSSSYALTNKPTLSSVNAYNRKYRFTKVYIDEEGDPVIQLDVNLFGGVSAKNLDDTFDWWKSTLAQFSKQFVEK